MLVKLKQTIMEGHGVKICVRKPPRKSVPFIEGAILEMSDASAQKYIDRGQAEKYTGPAEEQPA